MTANELRELAALTGDGDLAKRARYKVADYLRARAALAQYGIKE